MKKLLNIGLVFGLLASVIGVDNSFAASSKSAKKQSAISIGTKVRAKVEAKGLYDQDCYDQYYSCMDQFCIVDNEIGGSCNCNDDIKKYEGALENIKKMLAEAERISTEEVEKVQAGANADIIFNGTRTYDENNNVVATTATKDKTKIAATQWSSLYDTDEEEEEEYEEMRIDISSKTGNELYTAAHQLCKAEMDDKCSKDLTMLTQMYSRQIVSDCKGLGNSIEQKTSEAKAALASANSAVRNALKESLEESNKYDRGTCMVEYKKCMKSEDACGSDWGQCVFTIASENMQNNKAESVAGTTVSTINTYDITPSTMSILESKRFICEKVLDSCVAVRDYIWDDFLREAAPTIRLAEQNIESQKRQSCLGDISACIQKACKDDIEGKGVATMDACLARPDMARSFCKIQLEPCERMEPQIWDYVVSKLASMRVDACTKEVKDCIFSEDRCGEDFSNCIGMDFAYIHDMCPVDKLVVCKQTNPDFKMSDLDSMLMGFYLNVDNKALENCQNLAEEKMSELCGSTTDCNSFASDEFIGTSSVKSQKDEAVYRVTGMISFGSIKMGDATGSVTDGGKVLAPGEIGVKDYIREIKKKNGGVKNADAIISSIEDELNNIAGTINRTISLIESDQQIQYCINGRDLSQINGKENKNGKNQTAARFPKLLNQYRVMIGMAALRKAQDNYNKKITEAIADATKDASADVAQYMCNKIASSRTGNSYGNVISNKTPLTAPYSIMYEVGTGVTNQDLMKENGSGTIKYDGADYQNGGYLGGASGSMGSVLKDVTATFERATRICHICTQITTESCKTTGSSSWFHNNRNKECKTEAKDAVCEDVKM
ncbi:MAG: hypothetical protein IJV03_01685 [Alphaproteobacteria bacterium]|nr:hypothetical protein [Alphaproteobacteria bacterium]